MKRTEVRGWYPELFRTDKEALEEVRAEMQVSAGVWFDPDAEGTDEEGNINTFSHTRLVDGRSAWGGLRTLREPGSAFGMGWAFPPPPSYCFPPPAPRGWYPLSTEANWMHAHPHYYAGERLASELIGGPEVHRDPMHVVSVPVPVPAPGLPVGYGHAPTGPSLVSHPHEIRQSAADFQSVDHFRDPCGQPSPPLPATSSKPPQQAVSLVPSRSHRSPPAVTRHPLSEIDSLVNAAPQPPVASGRDSRNSGAGGGAVAGEKKRRSRLEVPMPTSRLHPPPAISTRGRRTDGPQGGAYSGSLSGVPGGDSLRPWGSLLPSVDSPPAVPQRDSLFLSLDAHSAVERGTGGGKIK
uniref:Uncharacterized protein n=1 Tax=Chromera velia CCMP2878 TaxID=1169474 RepID=A0A0G4G4Q5_9ALVE|eukprot:Cvel_558.t1-p1 / transcript=Cvel_558.t1 / gene=Cvel_558 / organism=Chromera_velia_CCMP2878 / gene_product=hypothetical protein / transcript_product=hypothetical protein / location=Cvel_scaffold17:121744-122796(+) / protein_length=351 / sequence_SO=supercontig / SO=protein_coding / is_pseudo=false